MAPHITLRHNCYTSPISLPQFLSYFSRFLPSFFFSLFILAFPLPYLSSPLTLLHFPVLLPFTLSLPHPALFSFSLSVFSQFSHSPHLQGSPPCYVSQCPPILQSCPIVLLPSAVPSPSPFCISTQCGTPVLPPAVSPLPLPAQNFCAPLT